MTTDRIGTPEAPPTPLDVLIVARDLICDPQRWTTGVPARDRRGRPVRSTDRRAVCWCGIGAVKVAAARLNGPPVGALDALRQAAHDSDGVTNITDVNDRRTGSPVERHRRVLDMYDRAIESLL